MRFVGVILGVAFVLALQSTALSQDRSTVAALRPLSGRVTIILPASVPPGYQAQAPRISILPASNCANCASYNVRYSGKGGAVIDVTGTNWTAGGDPGENAFGAYFTSPIFGRGVVAMVNDVYLSSQMQHANCLTAFQILRSGDRSVLMNSGSNYYTFRACNTTLTAAQFAAIVAHATVAH